MIDTEVSPIRLAFLEANKKLSITVGEPRENHREKPCAKLVQLLHRYRFSRHPVKLFDEGSIKFFFVGREELGDRTVVRNQLDEERVAYTVVHDSSVQDIPDVENIAGMLAVQCSAELSSKDIGHSQEVRFDITELIGHDR